MFTNKGLGKSRESIEIVKISMRRSQENKECLRLLPLTEAGLSSTPCVKHMRGEHLNISAFPVLYFAFLVKAVVDLIGKAAVITRLTRWQVALNNLKLLMGSYMCCDGA